MQRKNESESIFSNELKDKRQKLKIGNETDQQRGNMLLEAFALEVDINNMNPHELKNDLSHQKLTKQRSIFRSGKLVQSIMPFEEIKAFENSLEPIDDHSDEGSVIITEAEIFIETDRKKFNKVKRSDYGKGSKNIDKRVVEYLGGNCHKSTGGVNCLSRCVFLCLMDCPQDSKPPTKENYVNFFTEGTSSKKRLDVRFLSSVRSIIFLKITLTERRLHPLRIGHLQKKLQEEKKD